MPTRIELPQCMLSRIHHLLPELDLSKLEFYKGGMPFPDSLFGSHKGRTVAGKNVTQIYIDQYAECPAPGMPDSTFPIIVHECVHALQAQDLGWFANQQTYLTCYFARGSRKNEGNCLEDEAYAFEKRLKDALVSDAPCLCGPTGSDAIPWISHISRDNPIVDEKIADLTMLHTSCGVSSCDPNLFQRGLGLWLTLVSIMFQNGHTITRVATAVGAVAVGLGAAVSGGIVTAGAAGGGVLAGVAAGASAALVGLLIGAIVGGIIGGLIGAFVEWIGGLFSSDENADSGKLHLKFSTDNGHTWGNKASFERSRGQPSLAFREGELGIAWTGNDGRPNTIVAAAGGARKATYNEQSNTSGSGLAWFGKGYLLAWRGRDDAASPNVALTFGDPSLHGKQTIDVGGPGNSTPAVTFGLAVVFVAAVKGDLQMIVRALSADSNGPGALISQITLNETTDSWGTPAIAFGDGHVYVAWAGTDREHHLNVETIDVTVTVSGIGFGNRVKHVLPRAGTSGATGPALAWRNETKELFLAWVDAGDGIHVARSADGFASIAWESNVWGEISRHNAGPGLAVNPDGIVAVAWVDQG